MLWVQELDEPDLKNKLISFVRSSDGVEKDIP